MAATARKPEEIYSHPPPFAPPPAADEPLLSDELDPEFERIDDNICTSDGLLYLVKFKGAVTRCHMHAEYFLDHQDLVEAYWNRDDVPHHERHLWGSKELIEGKKLYDEKLAAAAKEEEEHGAAAAAAAGEPKEPSSPESEPTSAKEESNEEEQ